MDRDVLVSVKGIFLAPSETESDSAQVIAPGQYFERRGSRYITYEEHSSDFEEPIRNLIKIGEGRIEILKRGLISTNLVFEKGEMHMSHYTMPYGSIVMGVAATDGVRRISRQTESPSIPGSMRSRMTSAGRSRSTVLRPLSPRSSATTS